MKKFLTILFVPILIIIGIGYLLPEFKEMPCGTASSYNHQSFWHWPWTRGTSGHPHTGVDIFGKIGTPVRCQSGGLIIYSGYMNNTAGNAVFVLGPSGECICIFIWMRLITLSGALCRAELK